MKYKEYHFHELATDPYFRKWVVERDRAAEQFWAGWITENPEEEEKVLAAKAFLLTLQEKDTNLSDTELDKITRKVIARGEQWPKRIRLPATEKWG